MLGNMISNMMVKPGQSPLFDSPEAHGLAYENVAFKAEDGTTLRGWLIKRQRRSRDRADPLSGCSAIAAAGHPRAMVRSARGNTTSSSCGRPNIWLLRDILC